jgi:YfiH family protein
MFTGRDGGVSRSPFGALNLSLRVGDADHAVCSNRESLLRWIGPGPQRLAWMHQVHGARVARARGDARECASAQGAAQAKEAEEQEADAIFTDSPAIALGVLVADCAPVLLADPVAKLIGAAHAGRAGMVAGVVPALVSAMTRAGARAARMRAVIGPAICGGCYEVPARMREEVAAAVPGSACVTSKGTAGIDLRAGLRGQLMALGVGSVSDDGRCTAESAELFSHRRDGRTGRFAGVIWIEMAR